LKNFGLHVKAMRKARGMTQLEVSSAMKRDQQSLQRVESGRVNPSLTYLMELAAALGMSVDELVKFKP
jgi:transcriptional regulator with XRE-family HTH domain